MGERAKHLFSPPEGKVTFGGENHLHIFFSYFPFRFFFSLCRVGISQVKMRCLLAVIAAMAFIGMATADMKMVCYYTNWAQYRPAGVKYFPEDIDVSLCTHVMYAFAKISNGVLTPFEWNDLSEPWMKGMYERTMALKKKNANLKISISVGGWNHASKGFKDVVASDANMKKFIDHSIKWMRKNGFDGLDMDWEYPGVGGDRGSKPEHKHAFTVLIQKLRAAFDAEAAATGNERLLLTAAVGCGKSTIDAAYEVAALAKEMDFIDLMTYDLHGAWEKTTGAHIALYPRKEETGNDRFLNVDWAVNYFMEKGLPASKLVMGMGTYGRGFTLKDPAQTGMGAPAKEGGTAGRFTREKGFISYYEICEHLKKGWTAKYHPEHKVMYASGGNQWVAYDDVRTIGIKAQYIKDKGLGGGMIWALDLDDFKGTFCGEGKYPLLNSIVNVLFKGGIPVIPPTGEPDKPVTQKPGGITDKPVVTEAPIKPEPGKCTAAGQTVGVTDNCQDFIQCTSASGGVRRSCPSGLLFNDKTGNCDWPANVHRTDCKM